MSGLSICLSFVFCAHNNCYKVAIHTNVSVVSLSCEERMKGM